MGAPKGKHLFGTVRVGEKGQIVIPKSARSIFGIQPGDSLVVLGDEASGLALMKSDTFLAAISDTVFQQKHAAEKPEENPPIASEEELEAFKNLALKQADEE